MHISYKDRDTLLVSTDFGEGSLTDSGYARTIREWKRGTKLEDAKQVFEGEKKDVIVHGSVQHCRGIVYEWHVRAVTFYTSEYYVREIIDEVVFANVFRSKRVFILTSIYFCTLRHIVCPKNVSTYFMSFHCAVVFHDRFVSHV